MSIDKKSAASLGEPAWTYALGYKSLKLWINVRFAKKDTTPASTATTQIHIRKISKALTTKIRDRRSG